MQDAVRARLVEGGVPAAMLQALCGPARLQDAVLWPCLFCASMLLREGRMIQVRAQLALAVWLHHVERVSGQ
jgi:hypothetical protein